MIGYFGYPDPQIIEKAVREFDGPFIDLDVEAGESDPDFLNSSSCRIVRNIIANGLALKEKLDVVLASVGPEKCDGGRYAARILAEEGLNVIESENLNMTRRPLIISIAKAPLTEKVDLVMKSIIEPIETKLIECKPKAGFWGVPPNDFRLLEPFPDETHIFGWIRCVEAGVPADLSYELEVEPDLPTVYFAQSFCAKSNLARRLAENNRGLYIDCDRRASRSLISRIEAFLSLG